MDRIEDKLDETKESLKKSKWLIGSIKSTFGMIKNFFTGPPKAKKKKENKEKLNKELEKEKQKIEAIKNVSPNKNKTPSKEIDQFFFFLLSKKYKKILEKIHYIKMNILEKKLISKMQF